MELADPQAEERPGHTGVERRRRGVDVHGHQVEVSRYVLDLIALDQALETLATLDARKVRVIELRFFAGLTVDETAQVLEVSPDTVARDWRMARTWLLRELDTGSK